MLKSFDANALLARDCLIYGVSFKPSTINHEGARMELVTTPGIGKDERVGYCYDTILYSKTEVQRRENIVR